MKSLLPPEWDASPLQGYPSIIKFDGTHLYTSVDPGQGSNQLTQRARSNHHASTICVGVIFENSPKIAWAFCLKI